MPRPYPPRVSERPATKSAGKKPPMRFRAARQNRVFQDVVNQIQEAILRRDLRPGDTLPPEREMKEMFGTSRGTLREALRVLEQKGLIEIRLGAGGGAVVQDSPAAPFSESLDLLIRFQKISLDHLSEFREDIEGNVARLAAKKAGPEDLKTLTSLLAKAAPLATEGPDGWNEFLKVDKTVHLTLARATGNPLYILIHEMVHENIHRYYEDYLSVDEGIVWENYADLKAIVGHVQARKGPDAQAAARAHVRRFQQYMAAGSRRHSEPSGGG